MKEFDKKLFSIVNIRYSVGELEACIAQGTRIDATNDKGENPIHVAARYERQDFAIKLEQDYIDVNDIDSEGRTPVYHAVLDNRLNTEDFSE